VKKKLFSEKLKKDRKLYRETETHASEKRHRCPDEEMLYRRNRRRTKFIFVDVSNVTDEKRRIQVLVGGTDPQIFTNCHGSRPLVKPTITRIYF
jgi:hypothetical protein